LFNASTIIGTVRDNAVYGLTAGQIVNGSAAVSGTTFLSTYPTLDTINGTGNSMNNVLQGTAGDNVLRGGSGNDTLSGGDGNDLLVGGFGRDMETGGAGADRFDFNSVNESGTTFATRDQIMGFEQGTDAMDFSTIDANAAARGNQAFTFIGDAGFHGVAGELHQQTVGPDTIVSGDINGDAVADFQIALNGAFTLTPNDFIL
jgi:serralysin